MVALGASAGGIGALQKILSALEPGFAAPVLVVLHLDPGHASVVAPLFQRHCRLLVKEAVDGEIVRPGCVYVGQPDRHLEVRRGRLRLTRSPQVRHSRPSIDRLFESVAKEYGERAIAVVLSGSGSDGTEGILSVKERDGTTVAQDPATAEYSSMPAAASRTGAVDVILPLDHIPDFLHRLVRGEEPTIRSTHWSALLRLLRDGFGTDFSGYRTSTLHRRLEKRLLATGKADLGEYLAYLSKHPEELDQLHSAFLIKVSSFYRDPVSWREIERTVIKPLAQRALTERGDIRVWSAGCATGEEAYTLAILFAESLPPAARERLKIFATDIDEHALEVARQGLYDESQLTALTPAQRRNYFEQEGAMFRARKELRKRVIFGRHDLLRDPPIAGLDLLVCRNVLIYFNVQQKDAVVAKLTFAVRPGGFLFLGKSEGLLESEGAFAPVTQRSHIFRKISTRYLQALPRTGTAATEGRDGNQDQVRAEVLASGRDLKAQEAFYNLLLHSASVLLLTLDQEQRITLWNKAAERFFGAKTQAVLGQPLSKVLPGVSHGVLSKAVKRALREMGPVELRDVTVAPDGADRPPRYLDIDVSPLADKAGTPATGGVLVVAIDATPKHRAEDEQRDLLQKLRKSLADTAQANARLQSGNEELETLNEELQSSAEEQQTLNEELQSSNEELETTNEELQSTNEELATLNEEMRSRSDELERVSGFLRGLLDGVVDSILVCDDDHRVTFWSLAASRMFRLSEAQAMGQSVFQVVPALDTPPVRQGVRQAVSNRKVTVVEDVAMGDRLTRLRVAISPISDRAGRARGYVILGTDVTERALRESTLQEREQLFRGLAEGASDPILMLAQDGRITAGNTAAQHYFGLETASLVASRLADLLADGHSPDLSSVRPRATLRIEDLQVKTARTTRQCNVVVSLVSLEPRTLVAVFHDVTERLQREEELRRSRDLLRLYNRLLTHDLGNLTVGIEGHLALGFSTRNGPEAQQHIAAARGLLRRTGNLVSNVQLLTELDSTQRRSGAIDASRALHEAADLAKLTFPDRVPRFDLHVPKGLRVQADAALVQVFYNLILNAVLHNTSTEPRVTVTAAAEDAGVVFHITDEGPGIPARTLQRLRAKNGLADPSAGLGLFIARSLVAAWGGRLEFSRGPHKKGTLVSLTLNRPPSRNAASAPKRKPAKSAKSTQKTSAARKPKPAHQAGRPKPPVGERRRQEKRTVQRKRTTSATSGSSRQPESPPARA